MKLCGRNFQSVLNSLQNCAGGAGGTGYGVDDLQSRNLFGGLADELGGNTDISLSTLGAACDGSAKIGLIVGAAFVGCFHFHSCEDNTKVSCA